MSWSQIRGTRGKDGNPVVAPRVTAARLRRWTYTLIGVIALAAVTGPLSLAVIVARGKATTRQDVTQAIPLGQGVATIVAQEWLAGEPITVQQAPSAAARLAGRLNGTVTGSSFRPDLGVTSAEANAASGSASGAGKSAVTGKLRYERLAWDGFERTSLTAAFVVSDGKHTDPAFSSRDFIERHRFRLVVPNPRSKDVAATSQAFELDVPILIMHYGDNVVPMLQDTPSLLPVTTLATDVGPAKDFGSLNTFAVPAKKKDQLQITLNKWATAFATGNAVDLANSTSCSTCTWPVLGNFSSGETTVIDAVGKSMRPGGAAADSQGLATVRVQVALTRDNDLTRGEIPTLLVTNFDVVVDHLDDSELAPTVVAWGPVGSGDGFDRSHTNALSSTSVNRSTVP